ncbi:YibE/F family protein [Ligilactobacillus ceti]|uniref:Multitransmembrane protein n=1 Tax=Ligilactobacillus ceti DSM 22408 TaxID=1122146 RepID=A0A0R2KS36_9LACO|nr:YibE/F family protein [Ligilactobacillus ceti]KRN89418.1 hypothetical protein IV53_GL000136 [Ligilactobacillus ceti DSM 22408]
MIRNKKSFFIKLALIIVSGLCVYLFGKNDAFLYHQEIGRVVQEKTRATHETVDEFNNYDEVTEQVLELELLNGDHKGEKITVKNHYSLSGGITQAYHQGQSVFLTLHKNKNHTIYQISHYKRDVYLMMLAWLVVVLLLLTTELQAFRTILSVALNFALFILFIEIDVQWNLTYFFWLFAVSAVLFTALSLALVIGLNRQFIVTFSSVFLGTSLALVIGVIVLKLTQSQGVHYEALNFATQSPIQLFLSATLIGVLGAVMDAATDIVSTVFEVKRATPNLGAKALFQSGQQVGRAVMGPLINVLLLIFFAETFTMAILFFRTGNSMAYTFEWTIALGVVQTLISGIGIMLTIPLASFISAKMLGGMNNDSH